MLMFPEGGGLFYTMEHVTVRQKRGPNPKAPDAQYSFATGELESKFSFPILAQGPPFGQHLQMQNPSLNVIAT